MSPAPPKNVPVASRASLRWASATKEPLGLLQWLVFRAHADVEQHRELVAPEDALATPPVRLRHGAALRSGGGHGRYLRPDLKLAADGVQELAALLVHQDSVLWL